MNRWRLVVHDILLQIIFEKLPGLHSIRFGFVEHHLCEIETECVTVNDDYKHADIPWKIISSSVRYALLLAA